MWKQFLDYSKTNEILEDCLLPVATYRYKYMSDTVLLWTVFMFQVSQV